MYFIYFVFILHSIVAVPSARVKARRTSPGHNSGKKWLPLMGIFTFFTLLFHLWPPMRAHMDPYIIIYCFYMIWGGFIHDFTVVWHILKLHSFHILRIFQGSFCTSSGPTIRLIMNILLSNIFINTWTFLKCLPYWFPIVIS